MVVNLKEGKIVSRGGCLYHTFAVLYGFFVAFTLPEMPDINCDFTIVSATDEIEIFLDSLKNNVPKNHITDYSVQLKRIRKEIYLSPQLEWNSENLADKLGISGGYFRKIYKLQFKMPFKEDHINARISRAKTLLSDTSLTIVEIAAQCGFNNASHFMRTFKAKEGKTAVQFRKGQQAISKK